MIKATPTRMLEKARKLSTKQDNFRDGHIQYNKHANVNINTILKWYL